VITDRRATRHLLASLLVAAVAALPAAAQAQAPATPDSPAAAAPAGPPAPQAAPAGQGQQLPAGHPPMGGGGGTRVGHGQGALATTRVVGAAQNDAALPKGTVRVTVLLDGKPVPKSKVTLARVSRAGDVKPYNVVADDQGVARLDALEVGPQLGYMVAVKRDGLTFTSRPFTLTEQNGVNVELKTFTRTSTAGQVYVARGSHLVVEPGDDELQVGLVLLLINSGSQVYAPREGLLLPLPEGAKAAFVDEKAHDLQIVPGQGVRLRDGLKPGARELRLSYRMPYTGPGEIDVGVTFPLRVESLGLIIEHHDGLEVTGPTIEDKKRRKMSGREFQVILGGGVKSGETVRFKVAGLPTRDRRPRTVALTVAALILLWGLAYTRLRRPQTPVGPPTAGLAGLGSVGDAPAATAAAATAAAASAATTPADAAAPAEDRAALERRQAVLIDELASLETSGGNAARRPQLLAELASVLQRLERPRSS
jgi:hypothetical protein